MKKEFLVMKAVLNGSLRDVRKVLKKYKLNFDDSFFDYELLKAALLWKHYEIANFLLNIGCRVNNPNRSNFDETPFHLAMRLKTKIKKKKIICKLLKNGASIYDKNVNGQTPLFVAFRERYYDIVRLILTFMTFNVNPENKDDILHFHIACVTNNYHAAENFLKCGIDPNKHITFDPKGQHIPDLKPVDFAIKNNYFELFKTLLKYNVDLSVKNADGQTPLHMIFYFDNNQSMNKMLWITEAFKIGNDTKFVNSEDDTFGISHFHLCCTTNVRTFVQVFIDNGVNVNMSQFIHGFTPLHLAAVSGYINADVVKLLLKNGADPNTRNLETGTTALHLACDRLTKVKENIIETLLDYKANPGIADKEGCTPIHMLFNHNNEEERLKVIRIPYVFYYKTQEGMKTVQNLMSKVDWGSTNSTDEQGLSLFHIACATNNINQIKKFLDSGINIDSCASASEYSGFTALHFAVMYNQKDAVRVLLKRNANVNIKTVKLKLTPLQMACDFSYFMRKKPDEEELNCRQNQLEIIKLLILEGADLEAKDVDELTPLLRVCSVAVHYCKNSCAYSKKTVASDKEIFIRLQTIVRILVLNKANINARTNDQSTVLHILSKYRTLRRYTCENFLKFLIFSGVDVNATDNAGLTPLHVAANYCTRNLIRCLVKNNANPNVRCKNLETPLHLIFKRMMFPRRCDSVPLQKSIFSILVENGADINMTLKHGRTMLHHTVLELNQSHLMKELLDYGIDINIEESSFCDSAVGNLFIWRYVEEEEPVFTESMFNEHRFKFHILFCHVQKLLALGLPVAKSVQRDLDKEYVYYKQVLSRTQDLPNVDNYFDNCIEELERMKIIKIDSHTSLFDILLKNPHQLVKHVKRRKLINIVNDKKTENKFPLYNYLLQLQFKRGLKSSDEKEKKKSAEVVLSNILNVNLPSLCYDLIFKYLEIGDINNLIAVAPKKRILKRPLSLCNINLNNTEPLPKLRKK